MKWIENKSSGILEGCNRACLPGNKDDTEASDRPSKRQVKEMASISAAFKYRQGESISDIREEPASPKTDVHWGRAAAPSSRSQKPPAERLTSMYCQHFHWLEISWVTQDSAAHWESAGYLRPFLLGIRVLPHTCCLSQRWGFINDAFCTSASHSSSNSKTYLYFSLNVSGDCLLNVS